MRVCVCVCPVIATSTDFRHFFCFFDGFDSTVCGACFILCKDGRSRRLKLCQCSSPERILRRCLSEEWDYVLLSTVRSSPGGLGALEVPAGT